MVIGRTFITALLVLVLMTGRVLPGDDVQAFLNIPGVKGEAQQPGFEGWIQCTVFQYLLPGVPSPTRLLKIPPEKHIGIFTAKEVDKPYASFSKPPDQTAPVLAKAYSDQRRFPQWEFALCSSTGAAYMRFVFKDIVISGIKQRDDKQYVTFKYEKVVWNYTVIKK